MYCLQKAVKCGSVRKPQRRALRDLETDRMPLTNISISHANFIRTKSDSTIPGGYAETHCALISFRRFMTLPRPYRPYSSFSDLKPAIAYPVVWETRQTLIVAISDRTLISHPPRPQRFHKATSPAPSISSAPRPQCFLDRSYALHSVPANRLDPQYSAKPFSDASPAMSPPNSPVLWTMLSTGREWL